jgi:hypothetical protein
VTYGIIWGQEQGDAIGRFVRDQVVHDLGCGDQVLSRALVRLGAARVMAVDASPPTELPGAEITTVRATFQEYLDGSPQIDVAFVSWPLNFPEPALLCLVARARTVIYLGKCTDGVFCGWPGLFRHFLGRKLLAHVPHPVNTLCVYGEPLVKPREGELEERAGIDWLSVTRYDRSQAVDGQPPVVTQLIPLTLRKR